MALLHPYVLSCDMKTRKDQMCGKLAEMRVFACDRRKTGYDNPWQALVLTAPRVPRGAEEALVTETDQIPMNTHEEFG
jgi:hypothetical protein